MFLGSCGQAGWRRRSCCFDDRVEPDVMSARESLIESASLCQFYAVAEATLFQNTDIFRDSLALETPEGLPRHAVKFEDGTQSGVE